MTSALAHGLLLAIPLPETPEPEEPKPDEIEIIQEQAMDVARLPQVAVPEEPPPEAATAGNVEPARQQPQTQAPQNRPPESQPSQRPPRPEDLDQQPDPLRQVEEIPEIPSGGEGSDQEPGLQERLETPAAYVADGNPVRSLSVFVGDPTQEWLEKLKDVEPGDDNDPEPKLTISLEFEIEYQLNACEHRLEPPPQQGYLGIALDTEDRVLSEVEVLGTSTYSLLDEQAKKELDNRIDELPAREKNTAYVVSFTVNGSRCS